MKKYNGWRAQKGNAVIWRTGNKKGTGIITEVIYTDYLTPREFKIKDDETSVILVISEDRITKLDSKAKIARDKRNAEILAKIPFIYD